MGKVAGVLSVTRAFGDTDVKPYVTAEPHLKTVKLDPSDTHLIIACDGLWDVTKVKSKIVSKNIKKSNTHNSFFFSFFENFYSSKRFLILLEIVWREDWVIVRKFHRNWFHLPFKKVLKITFQLWLLLCNLLFVFCVLFLLFISFFQVCLFRVFFFYLFPFLSFRFLLLAFSFFIFCSFSL